MYLWIKYFHILIAILALGTSAGLGIVLEFFGNHKDHGAFVLRAIRRMVLFFVIPGYVLMLLTGLYMFHLSWSWEDSWLARSLALWPGGLIMLILSELIMAKQIRMFEALKTGHRSYKIISLLTRGIGAAGGLIVVIILYYMVFKP